MSKVANPIGVHGLVWAGGWSEPETRRATEGAAVRGYDPIEILLMDPNAIDTAMTRGLLDEYHLRATASLGLSAATDVSSEDPEIVAAGRRLMRRAVEVGGELGLDYPGVVYTAAPATDYLVQVGFSNVYVHLDIYHMNVSKFYQPVVTRGDQLGYLHIGESHRGWLGSGNIDFTVLFRAALHAVGYRGPITFEGFSSTVVDPNLSWTLAIWQGLWDDKVALARAARTFIDGQLTVPARTDAPAAKMGAAR